MCCLICGQERCRRRSLGDWEEHCCIDCGHYRVSINLLIVMEIQGVEFDIEQTRKWLSALRKIDPIPGIVAKNAICTKRGVESATQKPLLLTGKRL